MLRALYPHCPVIPPPLFHESCSPYTEVISSLQFPYELVALRTEQAMRFQFLGQR